MKKLFLGILSLLLVQTAVASNYPADYCQERVRTKTEGPMVFAKVSGGCSSSRYAIGYKYGNMFDHAHHVDAVINVLCSGGYYKTVVIRMDKEWNGTGFMSAPFSLDYGCEAKSAAFTANNEWDSLYGSNYSLENLEYTYRARSLHPSYGQSFDLDIWNYIISLMR